MEIHAEKISSLIHTIRDENPVITGYMLDKSMDDQALVDRLHAHYAQIMQRDYPDAWSYYKGEQDSYSGFFHLSVENGTTYISMLKNYHRYTFRFIVEKS